MEKENIIQEYLKTLNENEKKALEFAKKHLESSFDVEKSNGFIEFMSKKEGSKN